MILSLLKLKIGGLGNRKIVHHYSGLLHSPVTGVRLALPSMEYFSQWLFLIKEITIGIRLQINKDEKSSNFRPYHNIHIPACNGIGRFLFFKKE
jgi:hypothetical protein